MVDAQQEQGSIQDGEALGWTKGGMSNPTACGGRLSSFEALDSLLSVLCDQKAAVWTAQFFTCAYF